MSFPAPVENINRKSNQRTVQKVTVSLGVLLLLFREYKSGAMKIHRNPVSKRRESLQNNVKIVKLFKNSINL